METMTEYELRRLENIKRNDQMLAAALNIKSTLNQLSAAKRHQMAESKSFKQSPIKKPKVEAPVVLRRSLRTRGVPLDAARWSLRTRQVPLHATTAPRGNDGIGDKKRTLRTGNLHSFSVNRKSPRKPGPLQRRDAYTHADESDKKLTGTISTCFAKSRIIENDTVPCGSVDSSGRSEGIALFRTRKPVVGSVNVEAMKLEPNNIARLVAGKLTSLRFFPTSDMQMVAVGNTCGNVGIWNVNAEKENGDGRYVYRPHLGVVSGVVIVPFNISKMYSSCYSCYDGFIRMMDVEKEVFDVVHSSQYGIYSISLSPHDTTSLCFSEGKGGVNMWDVRAGKSSLSCNLHEDRINTLDFNSGNYKILATSSSDGTACIWDLRYLSADKPESLKTVSHKRAVHSAYFSPTGMLLATTSTDDKVGLSSGANYEDTSMVYRHNPSSRFNDTFRGIWGWDDSLIFVGNAKRQVDVISVASKRIVFTLGSNLISTISCRFDAHPDNVGMLAGGTGGGQVYILTLS